MTPYDKLTEQQRSIARTAIHMNSHLSDDEKRSVLGNLRHLEWGPEAFLDQTTFNTMSTDERIAWCRNNIPAAADLVSSVLAMPPGPEKDRAFKDAKKHLHREWRRLQRERADKTAKKQRLLEAKLMAGELMEWINQPIVLQRPEGTMFPALRHAFVNDRCRTPSVDHNCEGPAPEDFEATWEAALSFVIEHDWAGAFKGATDFDAGSFMLPATQCLFEFRITGRPVLALAIKDEDIYDGRLALLCAYRMRDGWFINGAIFFDSDGSLLVSGEGDALEPIGGSELPEYETFLNLSRYIAHQIRAVSIALDASVAAAQVKREPHRRNEPPGKRAKKPDYSYHVVSLARRSRADRLPADPNTEPGTRKRLHFRRGHWRRYSNHRTWINWMLVGDPDLGFVDKHYKV